ncbi:MAG: FtsX-like permease family protein [Anaerolineales bacterium]|nr:MAG: FtsX-like permease family protein [Anaerolineales bacterium]
MNIIQSIRVALQGLTANKLRSSLTMLGIIIGVAAVIALVSVGQGAQAAVTQRFQSLGSNLLVISPGAAFSGRVSQGAASAQSLTNEDAQAIAQLATLVEAIAPEYSTRAQVVYGNKNTQTNALGVTPEYLTVRNWQVARGRFIDRQDVESLAKVCALGSTVVEDLFGGNYLDPVGKTIKINRQNYQVVGVMASKGQTGFTNEDDQVFIPLSTAQVKFGGAGNTSLGAINAQVVSAEMMDFAQAELTAILRARHGLSPSQSDDFTVRSQVQIMEMVQQTTGTFTILLGSIAAISLMVGGIGIMNIMLVSVTERTREIGIRKAVGAKRRDILMQFLVEAVVLSGMGGVAGVLVGWGSAQLLSRLASELLSTLVTPGSVIMALGVSVAIGLFFGIYPANRAARLNPIEALRHE